MRTMLVVLFALITLSVAGDIRHKVLSHRNGRNHPSTWQLGSRAAPRHELTFLLALKQKNLDVLEQKFWAVSNPDSSEYRNFLSIEEISSIVNPDAEDKQTVVDWLKSKGVDKMKDLGDALEVTAPVSTIERLFGTTMVKYTHKKTQRTIVRHLGKLSIPDHIANHVEFVSGLSEFPVPHFAIQRPKAPQTLVSVAPQTINILYNVPSGTAVKQNSSASCIEFVDQYYSADDLTTFSQQFNVQIQPLTKDHIVGNNDPNNPQVEADLDLQWILAVAPKATGWFWIEPDNVWLYGFAVHMSQTQNVPLVNSISYGWNEEDQCEDGIGSQECQQLGVDSKGYVARVNEEFQKLGLRGITLLSASGDSGANGRTDPDCTEKHLNPPFPGASPFITSVGATEISEKSGKANLPNPPPGCSGNNCASGGTEQAVSFRQSSFASGGGFSFVAPAPSYQTKAVSDYLSSGVALPPSSYYNSKGRGFPDIAALGSQVLIVDAGSIEPVGGTSCSSPIVAGLMTLINDVVFAKTGKPLGFLNPLLYKMAAECPNCFTDITVGDNKCTEDGCSDNCKGYLCAKGWDPVTGLGTPNFANMLAYVQKTVINKN